MNSNGPVDNLAPAVDPSDLQRVFSMMRVVHGQSRGQYRLIDIKEYEKACGPGADVKAVWYRASVLLMLCQGPLAQHGDLNEKVFEVAAKFPMKQMTPDVAYKGMPFDLQAFLRQLTNG